MRFRFRYSLRTLLLAFLAIGITAGIWTRRSLEQHQIVRKLEGIGLRVRYDLDQLGQDGAWKAARRWFSFHLGRDWVSVPIAIEPLAENISIYPEDCEALHRLTSIRSIDLANTGADDKCLWFISRLPRVEKINLELTLVSDLGLSYLEQCSSLRELELTDSLVTRASANAFEQSHPQCRVNHNRELDARREEYARLETLKPDRVATQDETADLEYWLAILGAKNNIEKERIVAKHVGRTLPEPDAPNYPHWVAGLEKAPRDWYYTDAFDELGKLRLAAAVPDLERVARDVTHGDDARCGAMRTLREIADPRAIPILIDLLDDQSLRVAFDARGFLQSLTGQEFGGPGEMPPYGTPVQQKMIEEWRTFWSENADVIRPRRSPN